MINRTKNNELEKIKWQRESQPEIEQRKKDIEEIINTFEIGEEGVICTTNISSWRAYFYKRLKEIGNNKKFSISKKKGENPNLFNVLRIR